MVPEIFKGMEEAENSDGFDSFEEEKNEHSKKSGNPFLDFNIEI